MTKSVKPSPKQLKAAQVVRDYMRSKRLPIEDDEINASNGCIQLTTSDRRSAGDDEPAPEVVEAAREHAKAMRALSPLVYVSTEAIDEWMHINVTVKATPRKDRPAEVKDISKLLWNRLTASIAAHPMVRHLAQAHFQGYSAAVLAATSIDGPYGKRDVMLKSRLCGNSTDGWKLEVYWGVHSITRPASFKKLTPTIVLAQLDKLLARLDDPLNAMGWNIYVRKDGNLVMHGRDPEPFALWQVTDNKDKKILETHRGNQVEFTNRYNGKMVTAEVGQPIPDEVRDIQIEE